MKKWQFLPKIETKKQKENIIMKFKYEAQTRPEGCNVFSIYFSSVEEALMMLKTLKKHFKCPVKVEWSIDGETYTA